MNLELTDLKRYELELDNCLNIILNANRRGVPVTEIGLAYVLNISQDTADRLVAKLQTENIIK